MNNFQTNITNLYGRKGKAWIAQLSNQIHRLEILWNLTSLQPVNNLTYNYVLTGFQYKTPIVLKISYDARSLEREANALESFKGYGSISILNKEENALLMQQALPGVSLKKSYQNSKRRIEIACEVAQKLHSAPVPLKANFPHIKELLTTLDKDWDIPSKHLSKARKLKHELSTTCIDSPILIHGDLHQDNILSHGRQWLVIDPKGVIGYPIHDLCACVEDPYDDLLYIANHFIYPFDYTVKWYYIHLILAACWQVEDRLDPSSYINLANEIDSLII